MGFAQSLIVAGRWFSVSIPVSSTNKTDHNDITEILLKVALNIIKQTKKNIQTRCDTIDNVCLDLQT